jgi:hypothetical protein
MQPEEATFNRRTVGRAGIAWAIVQFFSIPLSVLYGLTHLLTPPLLILIAWEKLSIIFNFLPRSSGIVFFVSALVLSLLTIGLTFGVYRKSFVCAVLLFIEVAGYLIIAVYGLLTSGVFSYVFNSSTFNTAMYTSISIYIGIILILILFIAGGIWGRLSRTPKSVWIATPIILALAISIPMLTAWVHSTQLGSISGNIYRSDGTPYSGEVSVCCDPLDENVHITHGDPAPLYLIIHANGNYKIDSLPAGDYYIWAVAHHDKLFSDRILTVSVKASQKVSNIDLILVPGGSISGHVLDENGNPVSYVIDPITNNKIDIRMMAVYNPVGYSSPYTTQVATDGTYSFNNLPPGEYLIGSGFPLNEKITVESGKEIRYDFYRVQK